MTPERKAIALYKLIKNQMRGPGIEAADGNAKRCATICCDEIIAVLQWNATAKIRYWNEVKTHIQSL